MRFKALFAIVAAASLLMTGPAFAAWNYNANGWYWQNADGTLIKNQWEWLDGNDDGIAECYYFTDWGYCLTDTTTPDGYTVDPNGAWMVDGIVQTKNVGPAKESVANDVPLDWQDQYAGEYEHVGRLLQGSSRAVSKEEKMYVHFEDGDLVYRCVIAPAGVDKTYRVERSKLVSEGRYEQIDGNLYIYEFTDGDSFTMTKINSVGAGYTDIEYFKKIS